MVMWEHGELTW